LKNHKAIDAGVVLLAVAASLWLGFSELSTPALWHDELIHAFVGKSIAETGEARLPSGVPYFNGTTWNLILSVMINGWGMTESALRTPSVLFAALNVLLSFWIARTLLGRYPALVTAWLMALSPWTIAWAREARFYTLQLSLYLIVMACLWKAWSESGEEEKSRPVLLGALVSGLCAYALGILTSFHSILFLAGIGAFVCCSWLGHRKIKSSDTIWIVAIGAVGVITLFSFRLLMNPLDQEAVYDRGGLGGGMVDAARGARAYYFMWLTDNHSIGYFALAMIGFPVMIWKRGRHGIFAALAFWGPLLVLTFFIGYRRPRFMFFLFPFYVMAVSYGGVFLVEWLRKEKPGILTKVVAIGCILFLGRVGVSAYKLTGDSIEYAEGSHVSLARRHPQWKKPTAWVKQHMKNEDVIITTTFLPVLHYVGRADNWYPTRSLWWEVDESGIDNLKQVEDLQRYVEAHPKGYFISEWWRFERNQWPHGGFEPDIEWVQANMTRIDEASSDDVFVYQWGTD